MFFLNKEINALFPNINWSGHDLFKKKIKYFSLTEENLNNCRSFDINIINNSKHSSYNIIILSGSGADTLYGNKNDGILFGDAGDDKLYG